MAEPLSPDDAYKKYVTARLISLRTPRYSWWVHWRELAEYFLPRRYRWVVTPNQQSRGSPINQKIIDSTGVLAARNLASGLMSGKISPSQPWLKLKVNNQDSTGTTTTSLWLAECERLMRLVYQESNFYTSVAQWLYDLVIFGTAVLIIYHDFENVINCYNPCAGEYYIDIDGRYRPTTLYREFTMTISAIVDEFGLENCSQEVQLDYERGDALLSRELIVAHAIEPNDDRKFGIPEHFKFRECYWEWGASQSPQGGSTPKGFLRKRGYYEQPQATVRWDIVSNDAYGRSVAMDALGDQKQLQLESKRKAQAIDKIVDPPLIGDARLKNTPVSRLPGGITYLDGMSTNGKPGLASIYDINLRVNEIKEDLDEVRQRLKDTFYVPLFQPISQFETRSNVTAVEINQRKSESLIMLGPVFERLDNEGLRPIVERTWGIMLRAGIFPPPPQELQGKEVTVEFVSMLALAQDAANSAAIQQVLALAGNLAGIDQQIMDVIDTDFSIENFASLLNADPRMIRTNDAIQAIRQNRQYQQEQQQKAEQAQQLAMSAKNLAQTPTSGDNALSALTGGQ